MAWTAPMTAVDGAIFSAAQFNANIRDNFLETAPAKATTAGGYFVATGLNSISERIPTTHEITTSSESTLSTTFTSLPTVGPTVTVTTGSMALVLWSASMSNSSDNAFSIMSVAVTGASTILPSDTDSLNTEQVDTTFQTMQVGTSKLYTTLTPGINTFTARYRVTTGTGTFLRRKIIVIPF